MKVIKGTIHYEINEENNTWKLAYSQSSDNDLAVMLIGQQLMEFSEEEFESALKDKSLDTKTKKFYQERLKKVRAAKFGLSLMCETLLSIIDEYREHVAKMKESNSTQQVEPLTPEQQKELLEMMKQFEPKKDGE